MSNVTFTEENYNKLVSCVVHMGVTAVVVSFCGGAFVGALVALAWGSP